MNTEAAEIASYLPGEIRSFPCPNCYMCGAPGKQLHTGLRDWLFSAPGEWNIMRCANSSCGLLWLDPMPTEEDIAKAYQTYFTHWVDPDLQPSPGNRGLLSRIYREGHAAHLALRYGLEGPRLSAFAWLAAIPFRLSASLRAGADYPLHYLAGKKGRLLDVGCGNGATVAGASQMGWDAQGLDTDPMAVSASRRRGVNAHLGSLTELSFDDDSFDLILSHHVIEHVHEPLDMLREMRRTLRPGGTLAVITPNAASLLHRWFGPDWRGLEPPRHLRIFTPATLLSLARKAGFGDARVSSPVRGTAFFLRASSELACSRRRSRLFDQERVATLKLLGIHLLSELVALTALLMHQTGEEVLLEAHK